MQEKSCSQVAGNEYISTVERKENTYFQNGILGQGYQMSNNETAEPQFLQQTEDEFGYVPR